MHYYRFSPITTQDEFESALHYTAQQLSKLSSTVLGERHSVWALNVFAHYYDEYEIIKQIVLGYGPKHDIGSETSLYVDANKEYGTSKVKWLGVRAVDPYRSHVGCGDLDADYDVVAEQHLGNNPYVREVKGNVSMLELWHPDFDVLGYIVKD